MATSDLLWQELSNMKANQVALQATLENLNNRLQVLEQDMQQRQSNEVQAMRREIHELRTTGQSNGIEPGVGVQR